ncbi:HEPN domain-containing protein [Patescibacteria group bacterium AH-259-L07]|nr:HEPN domain-containing protein [Patescibacteria group bacterium AH-259-L07]
MDKTKIKKFVDYWQDNAKKDWQVAQSLLDLKHYNYSLFFCHLTLERLIKALVVSRTGNQAPFTHDLYSLILKTGIEVSAERKKYLEIITTFNMRARYDTLRYAFYKKVTKKYAEEYLKITHDLILWLKKELTNK